MTDILVSQLFTQKSDQIHKQSHLLHINLFFSKKKAETSFIYIKNNNSMYQNQSLVGSVVIGAELGREDHGSIPRNCDREGAGTT
jgi:hypothetical protein